MIESQWFWLLLAIAIAILLLAIAVIALAGAWESAAGRADYYQLLAKTRDRVIAQQSATIQLLTSEIRRDIPMAEEVDAAVVGGSRPNIWHGQALPASVYMPTDVLGP